MLINLWSRLIKHVNNTYITKSQNGRTMISINVNWLVIFVYSLLVFDFVLAKTPSVAAQPERDTHQGPKKSPVNQGMSTPLECARQCRKGEPPKICYYHFTLEMYTVLGGACRHCTPTNTNQLNSTCQCVTADGVERTILSVNRMLPGPSIQVCKNDRIIVDVENHMEGMQCTIHWHGVFQRESPYYDGVPFITQCPILQGNSFRYNFLAGNGGTHFWHAHTGVQKLDGLQGSLIIREPPRDDPNSKLYDEDLPTHVIFIADWMHVQAIEKFPGHLHNDTSQTADSLLINGRGRYTNRITNVSTTTPYEVFTIKPGCRYRFRMINSFCTVCGAQLTFEGHNLTLISVDGVAIRPTTVTTINSFPGERFDFIIHANRAIRSYWIQLRALGECADAGVQQHAILRYKGQPELPTSVKPSYTQNLPLGIVLNPPDGLCNETRATALCISQLKSATSVDKEVIHGKPCVKIYFALNMKFYSTKDVFKPNTYQDFLVVEGYHTVATVNNITFNSPPSPPLSQYEDIPPDNWCYANNTPTDSNDVRSCTQRIDIPKNCIVEAIFTDGMGLGTLSHPIHLHGHAYNVIGMGKSPLQNVTRMTAEHAQELDAKNQLCRNLDRPPFKDSVAIPIGGYVIVRFRANNPGWWLLHCHFLYHIVIGMAMVLHVGEPKDLTPAPPGFPKCGNFVPPTVGYNKPHYECQRN